MGQQLDASVGSVLADMPAVPAMVRERILARLSAITDAIGDRLLDGGTTIIQFTDLADSVMVISMTVLHDYAHIDVSTSEEAVAVSNGYDMLVAANGSVAVVVDKDMRGRTLDHGALALAHRQTDDRLTEIAAARVLMRTHPLFSRH